MRRVLLIGLDGFGYDFAKRAFAASWMPSVAALAREGVFAPATSTIPPVSTAAWTTVVTAANPGRHGILDFRQREFAGYGFIREGRLVHAGDILVPTVYELADARGLASLVINLPVSYPAKPLRHGVVVTGVLTPPQSERAVHPPSFRRHLGDYQFDLEPPLPKTLGELCSRLGELATGRARLFTAACAERKFDLGIIIFTGPDRLFHRFYKEVYAARELPAPAAAYLATLDTACAEVRRAFGEDAAVILCSDHGFGPGPTRSFAVNRLLRRRGLLTLENENWFMLNYAWEGFKRLVGGGAPLAVDWARTVAYGAPLYMRWGGVYLNVVGEQPAGIVPPDRVGAVAAEIVAALGETTYAGEKAITWARPRGEVFAGPAAATFPHLIWESAPGLAVTEAKGPGPLFAPYDNPAKRGEHTPAAMFVAAGPGFRRAPFNREINLADLGATVARLLDMPLPVRDGKPLDEIIAD